MKFLVSATAINGTPIAGCNVIASTAEEAEVKARAKFTEMSIDTYVDISLRFVDYAPLDVKLSAGNCCQDWSDSTDYLRRRDRSLPIHPLSSSLDLVPAPDETITMIGRPFAYCPFCGIRKISEVVR